MKKDTVLLFGALLLCSWAFSYAQDSTYQVSVKYSGALRNIMYKGDLSATASLDSLRNYSHLYALGAAEDLKGEILIVDNRPYVTSEIEGAVKMDNSFDHNATLLVYSTVDNWTSVGVPKAVQTAADFETFVETAAAEKGLDVTKPFPFRVSGTADSIHWHVISWDTNDKNHTHEKHMTAGPHGILEDHQVEVLGFYSKHHHAVFTHHSTNMHMHFVTVDEFLAGHIDKFVPGDAMTLHLPAPQR